MISIIIPTKNEEPNIVACVTAFAGLAERGEAEVIVVDNSSEDRTQELACSAGARVIVQGPERCAQRNRGWREARGEYVMFVDADMIVPESTQAEILSLLSKQDPPDAIYVREVRSGDGLRIKARNFERSFYDATEIDGLRVIRRSLLERVGGYDENLTACEDWDLDRRLLALGATTTLTKGALIHNERLVTFARHLSKKRYYAGTMDRYREKWNNDEVVRRQFSPFYRTVGVFFAKGAWKRTLRHPILYLVVLFDRIAVGVTYLVGRAASDGDKSAN